MYGEKIFHYIAVQNQKVQSDEVYGIITDKLK